MIASQYGLRKGFDNFRYDKKSWWQGRYGRKNSFIKLE